jgi:uncharacterized protein
MLKKFAFIGLLAFAPLAAQASNLPDYPFIHVSGGSSTYAMPDTGQIDFEIAAVDADPALALGVLEARANEIRALAKELGIAPGDIEIRDVRRDIKKPDANTPAGVTLYDIRCGVRLVLRDLTKWQALAGPLLTWQNLDGFITSFDSTQREKIEGDLMNEAIKSARRKAEHIASGMGRKLGPVNAVSSGDLKNLTRAMGLQASETGYRGGARAAVDRANVLNVTILQFGQSVDAIFKLK